MTHLIEDQLDEFVDGLLSSREREDATRHLETCGECRAAVGRLRALLARSAELPREVAPPAGQWKGIRERIGEAGSSGSKQWAGALRADGIRNGRREWRWGGRAMLAAAAVVLVVVSSVVTQRVLDRDGAPNVATGPGPTRASYPSAALASFAALESEYLEVERDLAATLEREKPSLSPETVAKVEASLRVIDQAIREARMALEGDPGNATIVELLSTGYRQKLDLLQRATSISSQI
jgi:anti-sigma-K factor RskA